MYSNIKIQYCYIHYTNMYHWFIFVQCLTRWAALLYNVLLHNACAVEDRQYNIIWYVKYDILVVVKINITFLWDISPCGLIYRYILFNKNQAAWYFVLPVQSVMWHTVAIIIRVILLSPYLCIRGVSLSSIHYNQSHHIYINQRHQHIRLIWS